MQGNVLIIAGSDSGGGAGIQADIKTVSALGGYAATAITALTAQNTQTVAEVMPVPSDFVALQMDVVLSDIAINVIKTGMLLNAEIVSAVADMLLLYPAIKCVVDPVMVSTSGSVLLEQHAIDVMKEQLIPRAYLLTPNLPEAALLADMKIRNDKEMEVAAKKILLLGCEHVLIKGGHGDGTHVSNLLMSRDKKPIWFSHPRIQSNNTHGTGCTMASAIATLIAQKNTLEDAVKKAADYVQQAIIHAPNIGKGHGPLNHGWMMDK